MKQHLYYETLGGLSYWKNFFQNDQRRFLRALKEDVSFKDMYLTRAGRTGIVLSLKAFGLKRDDQVLVPRFMSTCVLDAVNQVAMPSMELTERTKAVLFYHHWGYPQNYTKAQRIIEARKLWVIEDCAHGIWGSSQGHVLGEFGHTAIFSLSKIFEMTYAGALRINEPSLVPGIMQTLGKKITLRNWWESFQGEWAYLNFYNAPLEKRADLDRETDLLKWYATLLTYPQLAMVRGNLPYSLVDLRKIFQKQHGHFMVMLKQSRYSGFMFRDDNPETMAPLCFPVFSQDLDLLKTMAFWLKQRNVYVSFYNFDVNRCMFDPDYQQCLPVPLYASLPDHFFEDFSQEFKGKF